MRLSGPRRPPATGMNDVSENGSGDGARPDVSPTKLMVNYIPELMTRDMMYALFAAMGKIESCKLIANRGYGFVEFERHEDAEKARCAFNGLVLQGKTLKVSFALLNPENKPSHRPDTDCNLYVSNLPPDTTLERLNALFARFGGITNSRVSQGVGFVCFESRRQAEEAIRAIHGASPEPGAGPLVVKFANKPGGKPVRIPTPATPTALYNGAAGVVVNGAAPYSVPARPYVGGLSPPPLLPSPGKALPFLTKGSARYNPLGAMPCPLLTAPATVYVYNVSETADELALWQLFGPYGAIDSIKVIKDPETKKNRGFAFVNMREYDEAAVAIQALNGHALNGQVLSVSFKTQKRHAPPAN